MKAVVYPRNFGFPPPELTEIEVYEAVDATITAKMSQKPAMTSPLTLFYTWYRGVLRNPKYRWWIIGGTLVYFLSPVDVIPDFIPVVGEIDDAIVVTIVATELSQVLLEQVKTNRNRKTAQTVTPPADAAQVINSIR